MHDAIFSAKMTFHYMTIILAKMLSYMSILNEAAIIRKSFIPKTLHVFISMLKFS
jgi:hypothetical protein